MRELEMGIVLLALVGLLLRRGPKGSAGKAGKAVRALFCGVLAAILVAHLELERAHWQMIPVYVGTLISAGLLWLPGGGKYLRIFASGVVVIFLAAGCGMAYVFPVFELPRPTGTYAIGTTILPIVDERRREDADPIGGGNGGRGREVAVQIWYPASASHGPRAPYRRSQETTRGSSYQAVDWTHARYDAPVATGPFPLLIYNPGWNGRRTQNTFLAEELASHGYIVAAIDHPYNSGPVMLGDGRVIAPVPTPELTDNVTPEETIYALIEKELAKETDDALFALDKLDGINGDAKSLLHGSMDLSKIGAFGYSMGGAVAAEMAHRSEKVKAVLVLDTPLYGDAAKTGVTQPLMLLSEEIPHATAEELARMSYGQRRDLKMDGQDYARQLPMLKKPGDYQIALPGTLHTSFQDGILTSPLQRYAGLGTIPVARLVPILRAYSLAFFDQSLRGIDSPLLAAKVSPFPEAVVLFSGDGN